MRVEVVRGRYSPRVSLPALRSFVRALAHAAPRTPATEVTLLLAGDAAVRRLNRAHRGKDRTTDVLSFPSGGTIAPDGTAPLGDIVISVPQAARQARASGHSLARELRVLAIHGYLHLLGYDHEMDGGTMHRLQSRLVRALLP